MIRFFEVFIPMLLATFLGLVFLLVCGWMLNTIAGMLGLFTSIVLMALLILGVTAALIVRLEKQ